MKTPAAVVLCLTFAVGHAAGSDGDHGGLIGKRNAMMDFHDSLAEFASSLRNFEKKGQEVLDAAAGKGNASVPAAPEVRRRRRRRGRGGLGGGEAAAAAYSNDDDRSFKTLAYVTAGTDDLVQKRDDESLRVIRIKILHHGREEGDVGRRPHSKTTPCPLALLGSAAARRITAVARGRKPTKASARSTRRAKTAKTARAPTSKRTPSAARSTDVPVNNCAQSDEVQVSQDEAQGSEHHQEEPPRDDASEESAPHSGEDEPSAQVHTQPPSEDNAHEPGESVEEDESFSAEDSRSATAEVSQVTKGGGAKHHNMLSRGDHLRIHIVHKPSNPQADVNETFFANHSLVNKTGHDVLMVKTDDHFVVTNGSKAVKVREVVPFPAEPLNYVQVRQDDDQEPYFGNRDYVEEFEKRVRQVNESLQRVRNYRQPPKAKRRSRRDNIRFMRSLRFPPPERADAPSGKSESQRSRVVGAKSGSIRITINRRLDNEGAAQNAIAGRVAPIRETEPRGDGVPLRHSIRVLDPQARELPLRTVAKRDTNESSLDPSGVDVLNVFPNNSRGQSETLLNLPAYASGSNPVVSKYEQLRFRALALTCVLAAVSVFTVAVVLTVLYFDLNHFFRFKRGLKYTALDLTVSPYDDN